MSQHDMDVANGSGATVRADMNAALQALATCFSGGTGPSTTFAFMWWADTANDLLKQRNAANSAWINILKLSTGRAVLASESNSGPGNTQFSHRNKLINGDFRINQRSYISGAAVGAGLYGLDRWKMAGSGDTFTFSTAANKTTVTIPASKVLRQVVEGLNLQTGTYVLSWEGTAQGKIGAGSLAASGVTGAITGGVDTTIEFGPGTLANVQLELGTVATPFEHRPISIEEILCQRYLVRYTGSNQYGTGQANNPANPIVTFPMVMRAAPTVTFNALTANDGVVNNAISAVASSGYSGFCTNVIFTSSGLITSNAVLIAGSGAGSFLMFSAEL